MMWRRKVRLWLRPLIHRREVEEELAEEFQFHLERQIEEYIAHGLTPEDARLKALRMLGHMEQQKERCRDVRGAQIVENYARDLRYALCVLAKNRGFSVVVILSLALG